METVQRGDTWWRHDGHGTWYRWNETTREWELGDPEPGPAGTTPTADYRSARGIARILTSLLGAGAVLDIVAVAVFFTEFRTWDAAVRGATLSDAESAAAELRVAVLAFAVVGVLLATIPTFIVWFHRLYTNLPALGATSLRFGRGWAIGGWFVPILNLWRPKQIANDIWRASDPAPAAAGDTWRNRPVAGIVHLWWGLYLLSNLVNQAVVRVSLDADTPAELRTQALVDMGASALDAVTAAVTMWFVVQLTARQEQRATPGQPA